MSPLTLRFIICICLGVFLFSPKLIPQNRSSVSLTTEFPFRQIEYINSEHGLNGNDVSWIEQDRHGFMWFITENGLSRYDGYSFRSWPSKTGDPNRPLVFSEYYSGLTKDERGMLWFSNEREGLYSFDPVYEKFMNYRYMEGAANSLSNNQSKAISLGNSGTIWIATTKGLDKLDPQTGSFSHYVHVDGDSQSIDSSFVRAILFDEEKNQKEEQDHIWLINNKLRIECFNVHTRKVIKHFDFPFKFDDRWKDPTMNVNRIKNNMIWFGSNDTGIYGFDTYNGKYVRIIIKKICQSSGHVGGFYNVLQDHKGNLWTVNDDNEIVYFDQGKRVSYFYKIPMSKARFLDNNAFLFEDKDHKIWIGAENGLVTIDTKQQPFSVSGHIGKEALSVSGNYFFAIYRTRQGQLLAGAVPLSVFDPISKTISAFKIKIPGNIKNFDRFAVRFIYQDIKDIIWLLGDFGIVSYDPKTQKSRLCQLYVNAKIVENEGFRRVIVDKKGNYWAVNQFTGLYKFDPYTGKADRYIMTEKKDSIMDFPSGFLDSKNNLYLGRRLGAFVSFNLDDGIFKRYFYSEWNSISQSNESATGFVETKNGLIWFSTLGKGLGVHDPATGKFKFFTTADGLINDVVYSLVQDKKGRLWMGTLKGISCFLPPADPFNETQELNFSNYNSSDGLPSNRCSYNGAFCDYDGSLYFSTRGGGIISFHPDSLRKNETAPPVYITNILLKNKPVLVNDSTILTRSIEFTKEIRLSYRQNIIFFSFTALNFIQSGKNQYAYMLENYDDNWIYTDASKRFANYTNLDPGEYIFKVRASNNDGVWNKTPTELKIIITPPFWQTNWFKILVVILALAIAYTFYQYRVGQILLLQRIRNKIAADLHDDIGSTLNSISVYSEVAKKDPARRDYSLLMIGESSRKIIDSMSDIVWAINPQNDSFDKIIFRMKSLTYNLLKAKKIECTFKSDEELSKINLSMEIRKNFYLIFKEALNNLVKYSEASRASVLVAYEGRNISFIIRDNGIGFNSNSANYGNGIINMKRRAEEIKAELKIESEPGKGTSVQLNLKT